MNIRVAFGGSIVAALAASSSLFAAAPINQWKGTSGDWSSPALWKLGHAPTNTEDAILYAGAAGTTNVIQLTEDVTNALARIRMRPQVGKGVVLDGNGHTICPPDLASTENVYETTPLIFGNPYNYASANGVYSAAVPGCAYKGTYRLVDPRIEMTEDADGTVHTLFTRGTYDFWKPNGTELPDSVFRIAQSTDGVTKWHMRFSGAGTSAVFPALELMNYAKENVLEFAGGNYAIMKNFFSNGQIYDMSAGEGSTHTVRVTDGATLSIAGATHFYLDAQRTDASENSKYSWNFEVLNGATLNTTNAFYTYRSTNGVMRLENATWNAPGNGVSGNLAIGIGYAADDYYYATKQKLIAVNSTLNVGTAHNTGNFCIGRVASGKRTEGSFYATNCTINAKAIFQVSAGSAVLKDCTFVGSGNTDYAIVVIDDGELTLDGGTYAKPGGPRLSFGANAKRGPILNMANGTLTTSQIDMSTCGADMSADCTRTNVLRQTGGTITATYNFMCGVAQPCHMILEGGTYDVWTTTDNGGKSHWRQPAKGGWSHFTGNGGTVLVTGVSTYQRTRALFEYLDRCEAGPKGLNVDTNGKNPFMLQDVTNMPGEDGRFVKRGAGTLRVCVPCKWDVSETIVEAGTLTVGTNGVSTAVAMETAAQVAPGATLSLVGSATALTVDALAITNGTLAVDAGDVITVKGAFAPDNMKLSFSSTLTEDVPVKLFVFEQMPSPSAVAVLKLALVTSALPANTVAMMNFTTDATTGHTTVAVTAKKVPVVSGETVWNGADSDWDKAANWSAGMPTGMNTALLTNSEASREIAVTNVQEVGAMTIANDGYAIGGEGMVDFAAYGNSRLDVTEGSHEISADVLTRDVVPMGVASGAALTIDGALVGRGLVKEGKGKLVLDGEGQYQSGTVKAHGGRLVVSNEAAFAGVDKVILGNGTLEVPEDISVANVGARLVLAATNTVKPGASSAIGGASVFDVAGDVTFKGLDVTSGCIVKTGKGKMTIDLSDGTSSYLVKSDGDYTAGGGVFGTTSTWTFDEDGTPPLFGYSGVSVAGGELVIKGNGTTAVRTDGSLTVGTHTASDCGAQPMLTLDNLKLYYSLTYRGVVVGNRAGCKGYFAKTPVLRILNGSDITTSGGLMLSSDYTSDYTPEAHPVIAITNSTVKAIGMQGSSNPSIYFSSLRSRSGAVASLMTDRATLKAEKFEVGGTTDSRITGSALVGVDGGYAKFGSDQYRKGRVLFDGGTVVKVNELALTAYNATYTKMMTWAFDDATWDFGDGDFAITSENCYLPLNQFEMVGTGLKIAPAANKTFSTDAAFVGEGGLVKSGAGTLKFGNGAYRFTGTLTAVEGVVDLTDAGAVTNACFAGNGTIKNGTLVDARIAMGATVPNFANCTFSGKCLLDVGATRPALGEGRLVATYTGTAPDVSKWRLTGAGKRGVKGVFTAADGEIRVAFQPNGLFLIAR